MPGTPEHMGPAYGQLNPHTIPISLGILDWERYGNSMGPAYHKGVPCPWRSLKLRIWSDETQDLEGDETQDFFSLGNLHPGVQHHIIPMVKDPNSPISIRLLGTQLG